MRVCKGVMAVAFWVSIVALGAMMLLSSTDVLGRLLANRPITGVIEGVQLVQVVAVFLGLAHTQLAGRHVNVTMVVDRLHPKVGNWVNILFTGFVLVPLVSVACWKSWQGMAVSYRQGELMWNVAVPIWTIRAVVMLGFGLLALAFIIEIVRRLTPVAQRK